MNSFTPTNMTLDLVEQTYVRTLQRFADRILDQLEAVDWSSVGAGTIRWWLNK